MSNCNDIRRCRYYFFKLYVHLVFVWKYIRTTLDADAIQRLRAVIGKVRTDFDAVFVEMDGGGDHVHLLVECPPKVSASTLVNSLKGLSSRLPRKERPDIQRRYWNGVLWSPSYFASPHGGAPISILRQYEANMPAAPALSFPVLNDEACRATGHIAGHSWRSLPECNR